MGPVRLAGMAMWAIVLAPQAALAVPNLVQNPGFETGTLADWTVGGTVSTLNSVNIGVDGVSSDVHSGNYGVFAGNNYTTSLSQAIVTVANAIYTVGFWLNVYQADATTGSFTASFGGTTLVNLVDPPETDTFTYYSATYTATGASADLSFTFLNPPGWFGFDDVSVIETTSPPPSVPEPAGTAVLATGLAALLAVRRRPWRSQRAAR